MPYRGAPQAIIDLSADRDSTTVFTPSLTIKTKEGEMMLGSTLTFPRLTSWLIDAHAVWADRFSKKAAEAGQR